MKTWPGDFHDDLQVEEQPTGMNPCESKNSMDSNVLTLMPTVLAFLC